MENITIKHDKECLECIRLFICEGSEHFPCLLKEVNNDKKRLTRKADATTEQIIRN